MVDLELAQRHTDALFPRAGSVEPPPEALVSWPRPNYIDPETHDWSGTVVCIMFLIFSIVVFAARMWARLVIARNAGLDDLLVAIAIIPLIGVTATTVVGARVYGFQWHSWDQTMSTYVTSRQISFAIEITYLVATALTKISILCFYRRMTDGVISRTFVHWVWASIAFVVAYFVAFFFAILFVCNPVEGYWRLFDIAWRLHNKVSCHDEGAIIVAVVIISILQDFFICALPALLIWNLHIAKRQKIALIALFGMGILTCICGVMRTYYAIYVYYGTYDLTWYAYYGWIWTSIEADLGVVCASAPALKIFFRRYLKMNPTGYGCTGPKRTGYGYGKEGIADNSLSTFGLPNQEHSKWGTHGMPLDLVEVRTALNVLVEGRKDAASQASDSSLRSVPILPLPRPPPNEHSRLWGSRTTCERASSHTSHEKDVERCAETR